MRESEDKIILILHLLKPASIGITILSEYIAFFRNRICHWSIM